MQNRLQNFLNSEGQVTAWPSKHANKQLVLEYLLQKFSNTKVYTEREVNDILRSWHTFDDWAVLRRSLVDYGYMTRDTDGSNYRRVK
jgi:hypothetical protein